MINSTLQKCLTQSVIYELLSYSVLNLPLALLALKLDKTLCYTYINPYLPFKNTVNIPVEERTLDITTKDKVYKMLRFDDFFNNYFYYGSTDSFEMGSREKIEEIDKSYTRNKTLKAALNSLVDATLESKKTIPLDLAMPYIFLNPGKILTISYLTTKTNPIAPGIQVSYSRTDHIKYDPASGTIKSRAGAYRERYRSMELESIFLLYSMEGSLRCELFNAKLDSNQRI
jgi:hypothetical protein